MVTLNQATTDAVKIRSTTHNQTKQLDLEYRTFVPRKDKGKPPSFIYSILPSPPASYHVAVRISSFSSILRLYTSRYRATKSYHQGNLTPSQHLLPQLYSSGSFSPVCISSGSHPLPILRMGVAIVRSRLGSGYFHSTLAVPTVDRSSASHQDHIARSRGLIQIGLVDRFWLSTWIQDVSGRFDE